MKGGGNKPRVIIKRKGGNKHAAHHGGSWKVAYADFVTAMMALFIVLWLLTQADVKTRTQIARYFRDPGVLTGGASAGPPANAKELIRVVADDVMLIQDREVETLARRSEQEMLESQGKKIQQKLAGSDPELAKLKGQVQVRVTEQGLVIDVVDDARSVLFDSGSASLKPSLVGLLKKLGELLGELPNDVEIGGHTDSRPYPSGSRMNNWDLSYDRAAAARRILEENGLRTGQVKRVLAHADTDLLNKADPLDSRNRRLSILVTRRSAAPEANERASLPRNEAMARGEGTP